MNNESLEMKKRRCFTIDEINNLIKLYQNGFTYKEMIEQTGMSKTSVCRILRQLGVIEHKTTRCLSDDDVLHISQMYTDNISVSSIAKLYSCNEQTIYNYLKSMGIDTTRNSIRKHIFNIHYFDSIDTPNKAYILGMLYADGCNHDRSINLFLQDSDKEILEKICQEIEYGEPLEFQSHLKDREKGLSRKDAYGFRLHSIYMCNVLSQYGLVPNKSLVLQFPTCIPNNLISHFMRGYMDGDGHIGRTEKDRSVCFVGTNDFCINASKVIMEQIGAETRITEAACKNGVTVICDLRRKNDKKAFLDWIYKDADLKLDRKYQAYLSKYCSKDNINNTLTA